MFVQTCTSETRAIEFHMTLEEIEWLWRRMAELRETHCVQSLELARIERLAAILLNARHFHPQFVYFL